MPFEGICKVLKSNLEVFELMVYRREPEQAAKQLQSILATLDSAAGMIHECIHPQSPDNSSLDTYLDHVIYCLAAAITSLCSDPGFQLSAQGFSELMRWQRWIAEIFGENDFHSTDHIIYWKPLICRRSATPPNTSLTSKTSPNSPSSTRPNPRSLSTLICLAALSGDGRAPGDGVTFATLSRV